MRWKTLALVLAIAGCRSPDEPTTSSTPQGVISDAVHNHGRSGFYFLPPLVPPTPLPPSFDKTHVVMGRLKGPGVLVTFPFVASAADEHYMGTLDTEGLGLDASQAYQLQILGDGHELGFADIQVFEGHGHNVATDDDFELVDGRSLRVKVYLNHCGTLSCDDGNACTTDTCDGTSGTCSNTAISGCCLVDGDCDDGNPCTLDRCSGVGGTCTNSSDVALFDCARWDQANWAP